MTNDFSDKGWTSCAPEPAMETWAAHALEYAKIAVQATENEHLLQCEGTWFIGLDALPTDTKGQIGEGPALAGSAVSFATRYCGVWPDLHPAQLSVIYPGYPKPRDGESAAGFRYRRNRDAAHVDGIIGLGMPKRRFVQEPHAFVLGVPLTWASADAAPLVVWEGSHHIMRAALRDAFATGSDGPLSEVDVTDTYQEARREAFETCERVSIPAPPGSASLMHRLTLHGVAPWAPGATAATEGRMIAYFRPEMVGGIAAWLSAP